MNAALSDGLVDDFGDTPAVEQLSLVVDLLGVTGPLPEPLGKDLLRGQLGGTDQRKPSRPDWRRFVPSGSATQGVRRSRSASSSTPGGPAAP